jgi:hypothetical protein
MATRGNYNVMCQNLKLVQIVYGMGAGMTFLRMEIEYFSNRPNQFIEKRSFTPSRNTGKRF